MEAVAAVSTTAARPAGLTRDDHERALVTTAGTVFGLASAGAAMSAAAADAMFLSAIGPTHLGEAVAVSSALLAVVLAVIGGLADRLERRRVLATLAIASGIAIAGLAALAFVAPRAAAVLTLIGGKQLAAATDLAFWVVIAERLDARRSRRLVPLLAATGGAGAAIGAALVVPLAAAAGAEGVLLAGGMLLLAAGLGASRLPATRRVGAPATAIGTLIVRSWRDGARAVRRHGLARHLAIVVGLAGAFASLVYFALGVAVAGEGGGAAELAALLGGIRGIGQLVTLGFQLVIAPRLLARMGTGHALLLAPLVALAGGLGLVIAPVLAVAIAAQVGARVLDAGIETPAEKLAQTLLPSAVRGRVAGFLDGTAKRAGAVLGGVLAAVLAGAPTVFYAITMVVGAVWLVAATRIARELPGLAIEHVDHARGTTAVDREAEAIVDARAIALLVRELDGPRPERAAEVLARLHERGRFDAVTPLVAAATERGGAALWRALVEVLDAPAEAHGLTLLAAARVLSTAEPARTAELELAIRGVGLARGVPGDALAGWQTAQDPVIALVAEVAVRRLAGARPPDDRVGDEPDVDDADGVLGLLAEAARDRGPTGRVAVDELAVEIARHLAARAGGRVLAAARHLARALRRGRGDAANRPLAFAALARVIVWARDHRSAELALLRADLLELARDRVEAGASALAPDHMLVSVMRSATAAAATAGAATADAAPETAAALRLYGALVDGADSVEPDDLRRIARALGEPDDDVRAAAEDALVALGPAAAGELVATAAWGRRRARDRAAALLAELPVTPATLDRLIDAELDALEQTHAALAALGDPGDELLARRLDERLREIAHTVLLLVAARRRSPAIAKAAAAWGHARGALERARTLAVIEAALPRALVTRLVDAVDGLAPAERAAALARAGVAPPSRDAVIRAEIAGRDRLARALALHAIGSAGRTAHRETITHAAKAEALAASASDLFRRVTDALADAETAEIEPTLEGGPDMPSRVESLIALGRVPLLAALTTRQLADVAERVRWVHVREGGGIITAGDLLDALIVVDDGELGLGERRIGKGEVVDELACVAPSLVAHDLYATRAARLIRLERVDFEELVDDVPGLASAICRALGERARRADDRGYRSPLASRAG